MRRAAGLAWGLAACLAAGTPAAAQQVEPSEAIAPGLDGGAQGDGHQAGGALMVAPPEVQGAVAIMTIDQNAVFLRSDWGKRATTTTETRMRQINAENERLVSQFAAEEQELTLLRTTLPPDEFRARADEFDQRVSQARRDTENLNSRFEAEFQAERAAFFRAALPVLARIMRERGALVVLDQSAIFVAAQSVDVTEDLIQRVNAEVGAGPAADATTEDAAPADDSPAPAPASGAPEPGPAP